MNMTVDEQGKIIEAYKKGKDIEIQDREGIWWTIDVKYPTNYEFDFQGYDYRIKPQPNRWRAEEGELYYYLSCDLKVAIDKDYDTESDLDCYVVGNYFRTREDAIKARELLKECLTKFHESL